MTTYVTNSPETVFMLGLIGVFLRLEIAVIAILRFRHLGKGTSPIIDLLMDLLRGAVFHHSGVLENSPLALMGRFP